MENHELAKLLRDAASCLDYGFLHGQNGAKAKLEEIFEATVCLAVFVEGGIVQAVVNTKAPSPTTGVAYEVVDYDVLEDTPTEIKEYFENRHPEVLAYMKQYLPEEYEMFRKAGEVRQ